MPDSKIAAFIVKDKKILYAAILFVAVIIVLFFYAFFVMRKAKEIKPSAPSAAEQKINQQIQELNAQRAATNPQTQTPKDIKSQTDTLNSLHTKTAPPSQSEIQKQIDELNKLRQNQ